MPLEVREHKRADYKHENKQFRTVATGLKRLFEKKNWDGLLIANPFNESFYKFRADALLLYPNGLIVIDFKVYSGTIFFGDSEESFPSEPWIIKSESKTTEVRGGSKFNNPFDQLKYYRGAMYDIVDSHNTLRSKVKPNRVCALNIFSGPIELENKLPGNVPYYDLVDHENLGNFIVDYASDNYYDKKIAQAFLEIFPSTVWEEHVELIQLVGKENVKSKGFLYYDLLYECLNAPQKLLEARIKELKLSLQNIATDYTSNTAMQFPSLYARLDYIFKRESINTDLKRKLGSFRFKTNPKNNKIGDITEGEFYGYATAVKDFIVHLTSEEEPSWFSKFEDKAEYQTFKLPEIKERYRVLFGEVWDKTDTELVLDVEDGFQIRIDTNGELLSSYKDTIGVIQIGDKLALLDVKVDINGYSHPNHIVLQPDYLLDISSVAECFQNIGGNEISPWQLYFIKRFMTMPLKAALLKGNVANYFMDELIYSTRENPPVFNDLFKKSFENNPFEYTVLFQENIKLREFMDELKEQFVNLERVVKMDFESEAVQLNRANSVLEPAFINNKLGIQGRLDVLDINDTSAKIIELKSGKLPYPHYDKGKVSDNHAAQARMYRSILNWTYNLKVDDIEAGICYSSATNSGENIRWVPKYQEFDKRILNTRNQIVAKEIEISNAKSDDEVISFFGDLMFEKIGITLSDKLGWFRRDFDTIQESIRKLDETERSYFAAFYKFTIQELLLSKLGDGKYSKGHSGLWNKEDSYESDVSDIIDNLNVIENNSDDNEHATLTLRKLDFDKAETFNFRIGDICVLYQKTGEKHVATEGQIFKCTLSKEINNDGELELLFRYKQNSEAKERIFDNSLPWAVEHDSLDHSFNGMIKSLFGFIDFNVTPKSKRDVIIGLKEPQKGEVKGLELVNEQTNKNPESRIQQNNILSKALACKDYFLLIGPPGTGKTSIMLKNMVKHLKNNTSENVLVLAYTNRAVNEICGSIKEAFGDDSPFIRIGSKLGAAKEHQNDLLESISKKCSNRAELVEVIKSQRVYVSTVSSISGRTDLFTLKSFDTVIIDEASQILEPQLVGLLGRFKRFILIGDRKQLPAVSIQSNDKAKRFDKEVLSKIGINNLKESYFERLLRLCRNNNWDYAFDMLSFQGRMHEEIALFPNHCFYNNKLLVAGLPHQRDRIKSETKNNNLLSLLYNRRLLFIPSKTTEGNNNKVNEFEAKSAAILAQSYMDLDSNKTIGIITPYRNQITNIKKELEELNVTDWENITVDTVERYQGGQKDVIIISLCVNSIGQLEFLSSNSILDEESNQLVDRKLNVALTRAKEKIAFIGNPYFISNIPVYYRLMQFIKSRGGLIEEGTEGIISGEVTYNHIDNSQIGSIEEDTQYPKSEIKELFDKEIIEIVKAKSPEYPKNILGQSNDYNRNIVIGYGRAKFDEPLLISNHSPDDRALLYCYYNMRKHYFSQLAIFEAFDVEFNYQLKNTSERMVFFDWGCGPATAGIALDTYFSINGTKAMIDYVGIDISTAMLSKARRFLSSNIFPSSFSFNLYTYFNDIDNERLNEIMGATKYCILNFSYFFGNINSEQAKNLANQINNLMKKYPLNKFFILFQNSALEKRNHSYSVFKRNLTAYNTRVSKRELVKYKNAERSIYEKNEKVFYELLEL